MGVREDGWNLKTTASIFKFAEWLYEAAPPTLDEAAPPTPDEAAPPTLYETVRKCGRQ